MRRLSGYLNDYLVNIKSICKKGQILKIAFLLNRFPAISETFILDQIIALIDSGHEVHIYAQAGYKAEMVHRNYELYDLKNKTVYIKNIPDNKIARRLKTLYLSLLKAFISPLMVSKGFLKMFMKGKRFSYRTYYFLLAIAGKKYDVMHCHFGLQGNVGAFLRAAGQKSRLVTTFHGDDANTISAEKGRVFYKNLFRFSDLITVNSDFTKDQLIKMNCPAEKIEKLPVGLKIEKFKFKERSVSDSEPVKILTIARLVEKKGHIFVLKALKQLLEKKLDVIYIIAGDGPLKIQFQDYVNNMNMSENVIFKGKVSQDQALNLYQMSHIFVLPSVTGSDNSREGQALVLQEAQATGLPVVSTIHNGIPEGVIDGKSALLVPEKNVEALVEKISYLIKNSYIWPEMGKAGRNFVVNKYDINKLTERLIFLYQKK